MRSSKSFNFELKELSEIQFLVEFMTLCLQFCARYTFASVCELLLSNVSTNRY